MKKSFSTWIVVALGMSVHAQNAGLRVGAAKVDVTPAENQDLTSPMLKRRAGSRPPIARSFV